MKKFISLVAALAALSLVSFGFVACSDDDDDSSSSSSSSNGSETSENVVVTFYQAEDDGKNTLIFYDDKTWAWNWEEEGEDPWKIFGGTYTGNPAATVDDTTVIMKINYVTDEEIDGEVVSDEMKSLYKQIAIGGVIKESGRKLIVKWSDRNSDDDESNDIFTR